MTKEDYENAIGVENLAQWDRMAASKGITGEQLAELLIFKAVKLMDTPGIDMDLELFAPASIVDGNVIHVDFQRPRRQPDAARPPARQHEDRRLGLIKIAVPSVSPTALTNTVPSTSPNTGFPYSNR